MGVASGENVAAAAERSPARSSGFVRRSTSDHSLTSEDRQRLSELGLAKPQWAAVITRKIGRSDARQLARLRALTHAPELFGPSGACDEIASRGDAQALCMGHATGPFGVVAVRMPVATQLEHTPDGALRLELHNPTALEAKAVFSWTTLVAPGHLRIAYELLPDGDGWLVYVRAGVEMSAHASSAKEIGDALLKLEAWLSQELVMT